MYYKVTEKQLKKIALDGGRNSRLKDSSIIERDVSRKAPTMAMISTSRAVKIWSITAGEEAGPNSKSEHKRATACFFVPGTETFLFLLNGDK